MIGGTNLVGVYIIDVQLWFMLTSTIVSTCYVCNISTISASAFILVVQDTPYAISFIVFE